MFKFEILDETVFPCHFARDWTVQKSCQKNSCCTNASAHKEFITLWRETSKGWRIRWGWRNFFGKYKHDHCLFFFPSFCFFCCPCYMQSFHSLPVFILCQFWKDSSQVKLAECYHLVSFPSLAISWSYIPFRFKVNINKPKGNERMPSQQNPSELTAERKFGNLHIETVY